MVYSCNIPIANPQAFVWSTIFTSMDSKDTFIEILSVCKPLDIVYFCKSASYNILKQQQQQQPYLNSKNKQNLQLKITLSLRLTNNTIFLKQI
jgi:hypothetical protein